MSEPGKQPQLVDGGTLERLTGLTDRRHRQLAKAGYFPPPVRGKYEFFATIRGLFRYYAEDHRATTKDYAAEKYRKLKADRELAELKLEQGRGKLIAIDDAQEFLARLGAKWDQLLTQKLEVEAPARVIGKDVTATRAELQSIHDEIREVCNAGLVTAEKEMAP